MDHVIKGRCVSYCPLHNKKRKKLEAAARHGGGGCTETRRQVILEAEFLFAWMRLPLYTILTKEKVGGWTTGSSFYKEEAGV
ncbi:unnamed protein product [Cuscuta epithymum]|uniref:Uncharacterized protein n=1 Tax=Cuscuta epithymum TaxID=186058 RepID=A0AAV0FVQ4_9ASTE|nr:unnamed protein product [Cuscuta epithymum]